MQALGAELVVELVRRVVSIRAPQRTFWARRGLGSANRSRGTEAIPVPLWSIMGGSLSEANPLRGMFRRSFRI